jgi:NAD(P)-dependent dehydrogenase (short-subunit alcohol dehydrogenase family)
MAVSVVTGATGGIGRWIARGLAQTGHYVILVGRDPARAQSVQRWIADDFPSARTETAIADFSLLSSTRRLGTELLSRHPNIALLVNNAGIFDARPVITAEGQERVLVTNLLSPILLSQILLPALTAGAPSRIVSIGSSTADRARLDPDHLPLGDHWTMRRAYAQSKLALMMATFAIASQTKGTGVVANVVHPGLVATGLVKEKGIVGLAWRCLAKLALTSEQGAASPLFAALAPEMSDVTGCYVKNRQIVMPNPLALDAPAVARVWAATQRLMAGTCDA